MKKCALQNRPTQSSKWYICLSLTVLFFLIVRIGISQNLIPNGDFESGQSPNECEMPTGFIKATGGDAKHVTDGVNPLHPLRYKCSGSTAKVGSANALGAHSGNRYLYTYAGNGSFYTWPQKIQTKDTIIEMCVWYCGPQSNPAIHQNFTTCSFHFEVDFQKVGPDIHVPSETKWTKQCIQLVLDTGSYHFGVKNGSAGQYHIWYDDFSVMENCLPPLDLGNDTAISSGGSLVLDLAISNATFLWQDNSKDSTFTITQPGKYWVDVTVDGCKRSDTILVSILTDDGALIDEKLPSIRCFPNPTEGSIAVDLGEKAWSGQIAVYDVLGDLKNQYLITEQNALKIYIEGSAGFYFIKFTDESGGQQIVKMLKR